MAFSWGDYGALRSAGEVAARNRRRVTPVDLSALSTGGEPRHSVDGLPLSLPAGGLTVVSAPDIMGSGASPPALSASVGVAPFPPAGPHRVTGALNDGSGAALRPIGPMRDPDASGDPGANGVESPAIRLVAASHAVEAKP